MIKDTERGKYKQSNGDEYDGDWKDGGNKHGKGEMMYVDKSYYNGDWLNNQRHGYGEYKNLDGLLINKQNELSNYKVENEGAYPKQQNECSTTND
ncbi:unnamed protein product [Paramecium sonneborni]|uniref:Uncharacterized protein n=1 Tax=Paramecium sonneborni TaxID=65129 RepID=A0A8S1RRA5_9CILI|nr:unnamed protein product [Paramecium sonneborni]